MPSKIKSIVGTTLIIHDSYKDYFVNVANCHYIKIKSNRDGTCLFKVDATGVDYLDLDISREELSLIIKGIVSKELMLIKIFKSKLVHYSILMGISGILFIYGFRKAGNNFISNDEKDEKDKKDEKNLGQFLSENEVIIQARKIFFEKVNNFCMRSFNGLCYAAPTIGLIGIIYWFNKKK